MLLVRLDLSSVPFYVTIIMYKFSEVKMWKLF